MQKYNTVAVRLPDAVAQRLDAFVEAGRDAAVHPISRSTVVRDALAAYLTAKAPIRSATGGRRA